MSVASLFLIPAYFLGFVSLAIFFRQAWLYKNNPKRLIGYDAPYPLLDVWHPPTGCPLTEEGLRSRKIESAVRVFCTLLTIGFIFFMLFASLSILFDWLPPGALLDEEGFSPRAAVSIPLSGLLCFYVVQYLAGAGEEHIRTAEKLSQIERLLSLFQGLASAAVHPDPHDNDARVEKIKAEIDAFLAKDRIDDRCIIGFYHDLALLAGKQVKNEKT